VLHFNHTILYINLSNYQHYPATCKLRVCLLPLRFTSLPPVAYSPEETAAAAAIIQQLGSLSLGTNADNPQDADTPPPLVGIAVPPRLWDHIEVTQRNRAERGQQHENYRVEREVREEPDAIVGRIMAGFPSEIAFVGNRTGGDNGEVADIGDDDSDDDNDDDDDDVPDLVDGNFEEASDSEASV